MSESERILKTAVGRLIDEQIAALPSDKELERTIHVSRNFQKKMRRLINGVRVREGVYRVLQNVAGFFIVLLLGFGALFAFNENVRAWTIQFFRTLIEHDMTAYSFPDQKGEKEDNPVTEQGELNGIEFTYVPDGFEMTLGLDEPFDSSIGMVVYEKMGENDEWWNLTFTYGKNPTEENNAVDSEYTKLEHIVLDNGVECDFYRCTTKGHTSILVWRDKKELYTLQIKDNQEGWENEELIKVANGIKMIYE